jgi:hypothetical protein
MPICFMSSKVSWFRVFYCVLKAFHVLNFKDNEKVQHIKGTVSYALAKGHHIGPISHTLAGKIFIMYWKCKDDVKIQIF